MIVSSKVYMNRKRKTERKEKVNTYIYAINKRET